MAGICPAGGAQIQSSAVNFYPNQQVNEGAPVTVARITEPPMPIEKDAWIGHFDTLNDEDYFQQAGDLFRLMDESQKQQLSNVCSELLFLLFRLKKLRILSKLSYSKMN